MRQTVIPHIGMRIVKTAVAVMLSYAVFAFLGLTYREEYRGIWGKLGPLYACIACIVCTQSTLGQTLRQGVSRLIGVAVGGALGVLVLLLGPLAEGPGRVLAVGAVCVAGVWFCLLIRRPAACAMACIVPCVLLITGVEGADRYYYAAARILETAAGVLIALLVNLALPDNRQEETAPAPAPGKEVKPMQVEVKNTTKKLCVIGDPVLHSRSPVIQNTMIAALGLDYLYLCQPVARGEAAQWLACAKLAGYAGFNATMPHKVDLVPLMDVLDADAALFGAVNTVCIRDGRALGFNTDGAGFLRALAEAGIQAEGRRVALLGAGGAAKAVALKLSASGAERVTICNRTAARGEALCALDPLGRLRPAGFRPDDLRREAAACDLLINCTSLGMGGTEGQFEDFSFLEALEPGVPVCDLIYNPPETELLRRARALGHPAMNGMGLLIHQAVLALEHFTGTAIDAAAMAPLIRAALGAD